MIYVNLFYQNVADTDACFIKPTISKLSCLVVSFRFKVCRDCIICKEMLPTKISFFQSWQKTYVGLKKNYCFIVGSPFYFIRLKVIICKTLSYYRILKAHASLNVSFSYFVLSSRFWRFIPLVPTLCIHTFIFDFSFKARNRWPGHISWIWDFPFVKYICAE